MSDLQDSKLSFVMDVDVNNLKFIADGSFGKIYSCTWKNITCAIKMLKSQDSAESQWALKKLQKEITVLKNLSDQSRHFVKVHGLYISNNKFSGYLMEFCDFCDLRDFLNRFSRAGLETRRFPWLVQSFMLDVCHAMQCLQSQREPILHKDLAIDNVLITADFRAKLSDFGLSKKLNSLVSQNTLDLEQRMGIERRPPELLLDPLRQPDVYIDRFLFGMCLCEALICDSLRRRMTGAGISDYKQLVTSGRLADRLGDMVENECFLLYPVAMKAPEDEFNSLRDHLIRVMKCMLAVRPEDRPSFDRLAADWPPWRAEQHQLVKERDIVRSSHSADSQGQRLQPGQIDIVSGGAGGGDGGGSQRLDSGLCSVQSGQPSLPPMVSIGRVLGNVFIHQLRPGETVRTDSTLLDLEFADIALPPTKAENLFAQLSSCSQLSDEWVRLRRALKLPESLEEDILVDDLSRQEATLKVLQEAASNDAGGLTLRQLANSLKAVNCLEGLALMRRYRHFLSEPFL